jgi:hypothetical protein
MKMTTERWPFLIVAGEAKIVPDRSGSAGVIQNNAGEVELCAMTLHSAPIAVTNVGMRMIERRKE